MGDENGGGLKARLMSYVREANARVTAPDRSAADANAQNVADANDYQPRADRAAEQRAERDAAVVAQNESDVAEIRKGSGPAVPFDLGAPESPRRYPDVPPASASPQPDPYNQGRPTRATRGAGK